MIFSSEFFDDINIVIFQEIEKNGYFLLTEYHEDEYKDRLFALKDSNLLISCDKISETQNFMNCKNYFTYKDNPYKLRIFKLMNDKYLIAKSKFNYDTFRKNQAA